MSKPPPGPRESILTPRCLQDVAHWVATDRSLALKVLTLIEQASRDPLGGAGKPELFKYLGSSHMPRRISQEHQLVYRVVGSAIQFISACLLTTSLTT